MRIERVCWGPILMRCHSKPVEKQIKLVQILSAAWNSGNGLTYSLYGLDDQGRVWRRSLKQGGWVSCAMRKVKWSPRTDPEPTEDEEAVVA
jgi:hypothetical protein